MAKKVNYSREDISKRYLREKEIKAVERKAGEDTYSYYKRLAKVADQRLVRLEDLANEELYQNVDKWAYASAMQSLKALHGEGRKRFNINPKELKSGKYSEKQMQMAISEMKTFLLSPTSTKRGIISVYKAKAEGFNKANDTEFTWQDFANFFQKGINDLIGFTMGSSTKAQAIGVIQRNNLKTVEDVEEYIKQANAGSIKTKYDSDSNKEVIAMAKSLLKENGEEIVSFFFD